MIFAHVPASANVAAVVSHQDSNDGSTRPKQDLNSHRTTLLTTILAIVSAAPNTAAAVFITNHSPGYR
jgi:hypothetical protein